MRTPEEAKAALIASVSTDPKKSAIKLITSLTILATLLAGAPKRVASDLTMMMIEEFLEAYKGAIQQEMFEQQKVAGDKLEETLGRAK